MTDPLRAKNAFSGFFIYFIFAAISSASPYLVVFILNKKKIRDGFVVIHDIFDL